MRKLPFDKIPKTWYNTMHLCGIAKIYYEVYCCMNKSNEIRDPKSLSEQNGEDAITIPVIGILRQLRKFLILWIVLAIVIGGVLFCVRFFLVESASTTTPLSAMVGFYYDGIENGQDPNGEEFDANILKTIDVIEETLQDMNMDVSLSTTIRNNISVYGIVPEDTIERLTAYKNIFDENSTIDSAELILDTSYNPTQFELKFDYNTVGLTREVAANFLNNMLDNFRTYFLELSGTNIMFGSNIAAIDYTEYDYPQAADLFSTTLDSLILYIDDLAGDGFRSTITGYSFEDLSASADELANVDLVNFLAYVTSTNVSKDKTALRSYYDYKLEELNRSLTIAQNSLDSIVESIDNYEKDSLIIMAGTDGAAQTINSNSQAYDNLIQQKIKQQDSVSDYQSQISEYEDRIEKLNHNGTATEAEAQRADELIETLAAKINDLVDKTNQTSDDYFDSVALSDSYDVLVPASGGGTVSGTLLSTIAAAIRSIILVEALLFVIYVAFATVYAFYLQYKETRRKPAAPADETENSETDAKTGDMGNKE